MQELIFATNNAHKLMEIQALLGNRFKLLSLKDINCSDTITEDHDTLEENASQKAYHIYNKYKRNCFADDTGLETEALNGAPGVISARFSGLDNQIYSSEAIAQANIMKLLSMLTGKANRKARFRTVISLIIDGKEQRFEGIVNGNIINELKGGKGFGYDPIFIPTGYSKTFAEMPLNEKNLISHRALAFDKMNNYLLLNQK